MLAVCGLLGRPFRHPQPDGHGIDAQLLCDLGDREPGIVDFMWLVSAWERHPNRPDRSSRASLSPGRHRTLDRTPDVFATDGYSVLTGLNARIPACRGSAPSMGIVIGLYHDEIPHLGRP